MPQRLLALLLLLFTWVPFCTTAQIYEVSKSKVSFHSSTPQELIHANSEELKGILDLRRKKFVFRIPIISFLGFNSQLQREHFNENYMESSIFPEASFIGKIIEEIDPEKDGDYKVRAKGKLTIHGVGQERIIYILAKVKARVITASTEFIVPLADHGIKVPRVVYDKLATNIDIIVTATLAPR